MSTGPRAGEIACPDCEGTGAKITRSFIGRENVKACERCMGTGGIRVAASDSSSTGGEPWPPATTA